MGAERRCIGFVVGVSSEIPIPKEAIVMLCFKQARRWPHFNQVHPYALLDLFSNFGVDSKSAPHLSPDATCATAAAAKLSGG